MTAALVILAASPASADLVRAADGGPAIAVAARLEGDSHQLWRATDGRRFTPVPWPADRWVLDVIVLDDGTMLVANAASGRQGPVIVTRIAAAGRSECVVRDAGAGSDARFVASPRLAGPSSTPAALALVTAEGVYDSHDHGRSFARRAHFPPSHDFYGFYAANATMGPTGRIELIWPTFSTCSSSDDLEAVARHSVRVDGRVESHRLHMDDLALPQAVALGQNGFLYSMHDDERSCSLQAIGGQLQQPLMRVRRDSMCALMLGQNTRHTVAVFNDRVIRLRELTAIQLGRLDDQELAVDVHPDHRGRALVLTDDGRVLRFSAGHVPVVLFDASSDPEAHP